MTNPSRLFVALALCAVVSLVLAPAMASARGPSTEEERAKALEMVELLETSPSSPEAKDARAWLTTWLIAVPDISVSFCTSPLGGRKALQDLPAELSLHPMFSQAAFVIRNPDADPASAEVYLAGVRGALRTYEAMRAAGTISELETFEQLKKKQASGKLEKLIKKRSKKCK